MMDYFKTVQTVHILYIEWRSHDITSVFPRQEHVPVLWLEHALSSVGENRIRNFVSEEKEAALNFM